MKRPHERVRQTTATRRRADNLRKIINALRAGDMLADDIHHLLGFSPSGGRKYIAELRSAEMLDIVRYEEKFRSPVGTAVFGLTKNEEIIAAFLAVIQEPSGAQPTERPKKQRVDAGIGRNIHIMGDDTHQVVRVPRLKIPEHTELMARLFGLAVPE
jgi:hypothetical protein